MSKSRLVATFFLCLGAVGLFLGAQLWLGGPLPNGSGTCKAVCGLTMLAAAAFGDASGRLVGEFLLWVSAGLFFALLGGAVAWRRG